MWAPKNDCAQALPFGSARRDLLRGGIGSGAKLEPCLVSGARYRNTIRSQEDVMGGGYSRARPASPVAKGNTGGLLLPILQLYAICGDGRS
jgi:hypothetical protein